MHIIGTPVGILLHAQFSSEPSRSSSNVTVPRHCRADQGCKPPERHWPRFLINECQLTASVAPLSGRAAHPHLRGFPCASQERPTANVGGPWRVPLIRRPRACPPRPANHRASFSPCVLHQESAFCGTLARGSWTPVGRSFLCCKLHPPGGVILSPCQTRPLFCSLPPPTSVLRPLVDFVNLSTCAAAHFGTF